MIGCEDFEDFKSTFEKKELKDLERTLEKKLHKIFQTEYINSEYYKRSEVYLNEFSENDAYLPLIYFIVKYILCKSIFKRKKHYNIHLNQNYLKQLRNIFPRTFEMETMENSTTIQSSLLFNRLK
jgi:hypothetical protein